MSTLIQDPIARANAWCTDKAFNALAKEVFDLKEMLSRVIPGFKPPLLQIPQTKAEAIALLEPLRVKLIRKQQEIALQLMDEIGRLNITLTTIAPQKRIMGTLPKDPQAVIPYLSQIRNQLVDNVAISQTLPTVRKIEQEVALLKKGTQIPEIKGNESKKEYAEKVKELIAIHDTLYEETAPAFAIDAHYFFTEGEFDQLKSLLF